MAGHVGNFFTNIARSLTSGTKSVVGIDIGSSSIKIVQLNNVHGQAVLKTYGELALGPYSSKAVGQVVTLPNEKIVEVIRDLFSEAGVSIKKAEFAIPHRASLFVPMEIPKLSEEKLGEVIKIEARKYVPVPISEVSLDWWEIPGKNNKSQSSDGGPEKPPKKKSPGARPEMMNIMAVAIHKDVIDQYQQIASTLELQTGFIEIETFSTLRSTIRDAKQPTVIVDLGASTSKMVIIDDGIVRLSHTINKGAQDITQAVASSMNIDFTKAEEIKRRVGLVEKIGGDSLHSVISPTVEYVFSEVSRVMIDYQKRQNVSIDKIYLVGGGSQLRGLTEIVKNKVYADVVIGAPFDRVSTLPFLKEILKEIGPSFSVAIGLALRGLEEN